jgi:hypothetical protein
LPSTSFISLLLFLTPLGTTTTALLPALAPEPLFPTALLPIPDPDARANLIGLPNTAVAVAVFVAVVDAGVDSMLCRARHERKRWLVAVVVVVVERAISSLLEGGDERVFAGRLVVRVRVVE